MIPNHAFTVQEDSPRRWEFRVAKEKQLGEKLLKTELQLLGEGNPTRRSGVNLGQPEVQYLSVVQKVDSRKKECRGKIYLVGQYQGGSLIHPLAFHLVLHFCLSDLTATQVETAAVGR